MHLEHGSFESMGNACLGYGSFFEFTPCVMLLLVIYRWEWILCRDIIW